MSTLKNVWDQLKVENVDRGGLKVFLQLLSITLNDNEINEIFTMLDIEKTGQITYNDIRIFLKMTKVYDKSKYPKLAVPRRSSYKIHPE
jgi:Ca2+-binding EF-hand superfamily protein